MNKNPNPVMNQKRKAKKLTKAKVFLLLSLKGHIACTGWFDDVMIVGSNRKNKTVYAYIVQ